MRRWIAAFGFIALTFPAMAADFEPSIFSGSSPYVPAPPTYTRWSGFYVGGQAGFGTSKMDFAKAEALSPSDPFLAPYSPISTWAKFGKSSGNAASFGGYVGYNAQWEDAIIGIEANYNRTSLHAGASASRCYLALIATTSCVTALQLGNPSPLYYDTTIDTSTDFKITDYGTLRGRAGWAFESFLPYATAGLALGRAQANRATTTAGTPSAKDPNGNDQTSIGAPFSFIDTNSSTQFLYGYTVGAGLDVMLSPTFFLRSEYEYIQFISAAGVKPSLHSIRGALGIRF